MFSIEDEDLTHLNLVFGAVPASSGDRMVYIRELPEEFRFKYGYLEYYGEGPDTKIRERTFHLVFSSAYELTQELLEYIRDGYR